VDFLFGYCRGKKAFLCITKTMLRKVSSIDLDKARYALIHGSKPRLFSRLAEFELAKGVDRRKEAIDKIWCWCKKKHYDQYFGRGALENQKDRVLWTAVAAINHNTFPRLINYLLLKHKQEHMT